MGFKLPGKSIHKGTDEHYDAVAKLRAEDLKNAHSNPTNTNLDPYADKAEPGSSPNKILPILAGAAARFGLTRLATGVGTRALATRAGTQITKYIKPKNLNFIMPDRGISGPGAGAFTEAAKQMATGGGGGLIKKGLKMGWKALSHPLSTLGLGYFYGKPQGRKEERDRLKKLGEDLNKDGTPKSNKKSNTKGRKTSRGSGAYSQAKSRNPKLDSLIRKRRGLAKGTEEYNAIQNQINVAYGDPTRHGVTKSMSTKGRKTTRFIDTPGISEKTIIGKKRRSGKLKKRITDIDRDPGMGRDRQIKELYRKSGARRKTVETYQSGQAIAGGQLGAKKVKTKYDRAGNVKKTITKEGGRRVVRDAQGNVIRSRRTFNRKWD